MAKLEEVTGDRKRQKMSTDDGNTSAQKLPKDTLAEAQDTGAATCLIPTFADACKFVNSQYSCLVVDTSRRHVALSPMYLKKKKTGIQEQLNAELLKYSESMHGVPLAYDNIKVVGQYGDIYDDQGFIHIDVEATFVIFQPKRGQKLLGTINKLGASHVGCLVHGCFNASIPMPRQVSLEMWKTVGLNIGDTLEFEVSHLDMDAAGVFLIRGRLEKKRVMELMTAEESGKCVVEEGHVKPDGGDSTDGRKVKKRKDKSQDAKEDGLASHADSCEPPRNVEAVCVNGEAKSKKRKRKEFSEDPNSAADISSEKHKDDKVKERQSWSAEGEGPESDSDMPRPKKKKKKKKKSLGLFPSE